MTTAGPPEPSAEPAPRPPSPGAPADPQDRVAPASPAESDDAVGLHRRDARKRFIFVGFGIGILIVVSIGLFTDIGSNSQPSGSSGSAADSNSSRGGGQPQPGDSVPSFSARNVGPKGGATVEVSAQRPRSGAPTVLLFFGNWCASCHQELPPLAAAVRQQQAEKGTLSHIRVVGIDSEDSVSSARTFIKSSGVSFPVAYDPNVTITEGTFDFHGDPYTVFVGASGRISKIAYGDTLTPAEFTADEQELIPSGT